MQIYQVTLTAHLYKNFVNKVNRYRLKIKKSIDLSKHIEFDIVTHAVYISAK